METITASITLPTENINAFADALGYFEFVINPEDETQQLPNPETRLEFVKRLFLEHSLDWFMQVTEGQIRTAKGLEANGLVASAREQLKQAITFN